MAPQVTNITLSDGFGSQYQHIICTLLICYRNGYEFIYNTLKQMHHNYDNDPDFLNKMEDLMNIKPYFIHRGDERLVDAHLTVCDMSAKYVVDKDVDGYATDESLLKIKTMFWANKDKEVFKNNKTNVAVHIRRPNIHDTRVQGSDTPDQYYLNVIQRIRNEHPDKDLLFHIYSQGNMENFKCYESEDTVFHLNEDLSRTFIELVAAEILVTSFSSFSYIAGYLNDGIVYYHDFWHPPRNCWIRI
jgi:hypothetical protein